MTGAGDFEQLVLAGRGRSQALRIAQGNGGISFSMDYKRWRGGPADRFLGAHASQVEAPSAHAKRKASEVERGAKQEG